MFYTHKFIPIDNQIVTNLRSKHVSLKDTRDFYLNELKKNPTDVKLVEMYLNAKKQADKAWSELRAAKKEQKIFQFGSLHHFLERLGLAILLLVYASYNLYRSLYFERKNISSKVFHTFLISVAMFYFFWIFNTFQDLSIITYLLVTIVSALFVSLGLYLYTRYKKNYINKLKGDIREISQFTVKNTKESKQSDMFELFENLADSQK